MSGRYNIYNRWEQPFAHRAFLYYHQLGMRLKGRRTLLSSEDGASNSKLALVRATSPSGVAYILGALIEGKALFSPLDGGKDFHSLGEDSEAYVFDIDSDRAIDNGNYELTVFAELLNPLLKEEGSSEFYDLGLRKVELLHTSLRKLHLAKSATYGWFEMLYGGPYIDSEHYSNPVLQFNSINIEHASRASDFDRKMKKALDERDRMVARGGFSNFRLEEFF